MAVLEWQSLLLLDVDGKIHTMFVPAILELKNYTIKTKSAPTALYYQFLYYSFKEQKQQEQITG